MVIRSINPIDFNRQELRPATPRSVINSSSHKIDEIPEANLQDEMNAAMEEIADLFSTFGRFSKFGRKNDSADNDFVSSMLEDKADEKLGVIVKNINKFQGLSEFLNFSRSLFPNDSDLMLALRELLLSRKLSELQKRKIKDSILDLEKFCDSKKMNSGINIGHLAKCFSNRESNQPISPKELRSSYLRFIELNVPASFIYQDWIDEFGYHNRTRLLSFTLSALVADMKSSMPGIHFEEFGPLSMKLSDARVLNTLDGSLVENFNNLSFYEKFNHSDESIIEEKIINLFMIGLTNYDIFEQSLLEFSLKYMSELYIKQRATTIQVLRNAYNSTPEYLFTEPACRLLIQDFMSSLMLSIHEKEMNNNYW